MSMSHIAQAQQGAVPPREVSRADPEMIRQIEPRVQIIGQVCRVNSKASIESLWWLSFSYYTEFLHLIFMRLLGISSFLAYFLMSLPI